MSTSIKALNEVMRNPKTYSQTKALYSYLWVRADSKSGLSYPPKAQILAEVNLTEKLFNQCLAVLKNNGYEWQVRETYYKPNMITKDNIIYINDYDTYVKKIGYIKENETSIIIDDLG